MPDPGLDLKGTSSFCFLTLGSQLLCKKGDCPQSPKLQPAPATGIRCHVAERGHSQEHPGARSWPCHQLSPAQ